MLRALLRCLAPGNRPSPAPMELTVQDQWVLKILFRLRRPAALEEIVELALDERPGLLPHDLAAAVQKLVRSGMVKDLPPGRYAPTGRGRTVRSILPERPGVNIDYYG